MAKEIAPNRAYLIRCWQDSNAAAASQNWHFTLEEVLHERQLWRFEKLDELIEFFHSELTIMNET